MIRVAMVNTARSKGGAARVASLLAQTLHDQFDDVEVTMFHCEDRVIDPPFHGLRHPFSRPLNAFLARLGGSTWVYDMGVAEEIIERTRDADILHLHNLHGYYLNYIKLLQAWKHRPVVWTLHDMWALTGRCGASSPCEEWREGCIACPNKRFYPKAWIDRAHKEFHIKTSLYASMDRMAVVTPSQWLNDLVTERGFPPKNAHLIPNPIDTLNFIFIDKQLARKYLNLPEDAFIALFVASDCSDNRKGYSDFAHAVHITGCLGVAVGKLPTNPAKGIVHKGGLKEKTAINRYYCAADAFIIPTYADNYPNTVIEALVSGTPVIGYAEGGIPSQLDLPHCRIIEKGNRQALADALKDIAACGGKEDDMSRTLSATAKNRWSAKAAVDQYHDVYNAVTHR